MQKRKTYNLSPSAELAMEEIFDYTIEAYGVNQAENYTNKLYSRFEWLAENAHLGNERDEVKEGYLSYFQGKHTIFYRDAKDGIEIIGIPHQSEDIEQHFEIDNPNPSYKDLLDELGSPDEALEISQQEHDDLEP